MESLVSLFSPLLPGFECLYLKAMERLEGSSNVRLVLHRSTFLFCNFDHVSFVQMPLSLGALLPPLFGSIGNSISVLVLNLIPFVCKRYNRCSSLFMNYYGFHCLPMWSSLAMIRATIVCAVTLYLVWTPRYADYKLIGLVLLFFTEFVNMCHMAYMLDYYEVGTLIYLVNTMELLYGFTLTYCAYVLGLMFFVTKFPECKYPGKFDIYVRGFSMPFN
jgi:hypothetical protein